jgi:hypothetical protein
LYTRGLVRRVYNELARVLRSTFESEEDMTLPALTQLQYLSWVLNEGLRMCTSLPVLTA